MKVFSVFGISGSGKTTTIERIIAELKKRRYSVGSIKEIHFEKFAIDQEGTNTDRHKKAGAELVTARGYYETDILYPTRLSLDEILKHYYYDYVVVEGIAAGNFPKIIAAADVEQIDQRLDNTVFAIAGKIANQMSEYRGLPVISGIDQVEKLVDLIEDKVFEQLPDFPKECCSACGYSCRELGINILKGRASREDCVLSSARIKLFFDNREVELVPFVQNLLENVVTGVVRELKGYQPGSSIEVRIGCDEKR